MDLRLGSLIRSWSWLGKDEEGLGERGRRKDFRERFGEEIEKGVLKNKKKG